MNEAAFQAIQRRFAAHLRDPDNAPAPPVEERRLQIYRDLFFNNVESFLRLGFPVLHRLLPAARWQALARAFLVQHRCQSPYFRDISREFVTFLASDAFQPATDDPPFLCELAHYEWMELVLDTSEASLPESGFHPGGDLLVGAPVLSPLVCVLSYHWPVHRIGPAYQPQAPLPQPVWLLVYRDAEDRVRFMEINAVTARLLALMQAQPLHSGKRLLTALAGELGQPPDGVLRHGAGLLDGLRQRGILLGTRLDDVSRLPADGH